MAYSLSEQITVRAICSTCGASGIKDGFVDEKGVGEICPRCGGEGSIEVHYAPFTKRRSLARAVTVRFANGTTMPYSQFFRRKGRVPSPARPRTKV